MHVIYENIHKRVFCYWYSDHETYKYQVGESAVVEQQHPPCDLMLPSLSSISLMLSSSSPAAGATARRELRGGASPLSTRNAKEIMAMPDYCSLAVLYLWLYCTVLNYLTDFLAITFWFSDVEMALVAVLLSRLTPPTRLIIADPLLRDARGQSLYLLFTGWTEIVNATPVNTTLDPAAGATYQCAKRSLIRAVLVVVVLVFHPLETHGF